MGIQKTVLIKALSEGNLVQHRVMSREEILQAIWDDSSFKLNNVLDSTVSRQKKSLTVFPGIKIVAIYGSGYKVVVDNSY